MVIATGCCKGLLQGSAARLCSLESVLYSVMLQLHWVNWLMLCLGQLTLCCFLFSLSSHTHTHTHTHTLHRIGFPSRVHPVILTISAQTRSTLSSQFSPHCPPLMATPPRTLPPHPAHLTCWSSVLATHPGSPAPPSPSPPPPTPTLITHRCTRECLEICHRHCSSPL